VSSHWGEDLPLSSSKLTPERAQAAAGHLIGDELRRSGWKEGNPSEPFKNAARQ